MENMFKLKPHEYVAQIDPIAQSIEQSAVYLSKVKSIPLDEAKAIVIDTFKNNKSGNIKDPKIKYYDKNEVGDTVKKVGKLSAYIKRHTSEQNILVPSLTTYHRHDKKESLQANYVTQNTINRSKEKKKAFVAKSKGDVEGSIRHTGNQKKLKIDNNSLSGAYCITSTAVGDKSAHYTLTSITRCISSIGNAITENMVSGNRHYFEPMVARNHLVSLICNTDRTKVKNAIDKFNLHIPTDIEILELVKRSTRLYWKDEVQEAKLLKFISTLDDIERCIVSYVNDLYHIRFFNDELMYSFIDNMSEKVKKSPTLLTPEDELEYIKNCDEWVLNTVHHILIEDIKAVDVKYDKLLGTPLLSCLAATSESVYNALTDYKELIVAFFATTNLPTEISRFPSVTRRVTVLSDTDSTCATYQDWVKWFNKGEIVFSEKSVGVSVSVLTIVTQTLDHILNQFSTNMNIPYEKVSLLAMKNEFFWMTMTPMDVSKHYFADTCVQEGFSFDETNPDKLEIKGVQMIASTIPEQYKKESLDMMKEVNSLAGSGKKLSLLKYLKRIGEIEREIKNRVLSLDTEILKIEKIKNKDAYKLKNNPERTPYVHHMLWEEVFAEKYGHADNPPYTAVKVPTKIRHNRDMMTFLDSLPDQELAERFRKFLKKTGKSEIKSFKVPLSVTEDGVIPSEFESIIDESRIVFDIVNVFYLILKGMSFFRKPNMTISDLGY